MYFFCTQAMIQSSKKTMMNAARLSVGLETLDDLIWDLERGLQAAAKTTDPVKEEARV